MTEYMKWGKQPAHALYIDDYWNREGPSIKQLADDLDIPHTHLENVMYGRTRPRPDVLNKLEEYFRVPADELFTPEVLAAPFDAGKPGPGAGVVRKSHRKCNHENTPADRRYCRLGRI